MLLTPQPQAQAKRQQEAEAKDHGNHKPKTTDTENYPSFNFFELSTSPLFLNTMEAMKTQKTEKPQGVFGQPTQANSPCPRRESYDRYRRQPGEIPFLIPQQNQHGGDGNFGHPALLYHCLQ
jgi:hypothetical protein